ARLVRTLTEAAADRGAAVYAHSPVRSIEPDGDGVRVSAGDGHLRAEAAVIACDGLIGGLLPELAGAVYPVRGHVAATAPLERMPLHCPTHSQHGFMYYRPTADGRVVAGGGRLEHLEAEYTDDECTSVAVQAELDRFLADQLGLAGVPVTHRWAGIMGFS